jgi:hypothetical protein
MINESIILYKETKQETNNLIKLLHLEVKYFFSRGHKLNTIYTSMNDSNKNIRILRHIHDVNELTKKNGKLQFIEAETLEHPKEFLKLSIQELEENYV